MFCSKCGSKTNEGASFCSACGTPVSNSATDLQMSASPVTHQQGNPSVESKKKVSKKVIVIVVCLIFAVIFVGKLLSPGGDGGTPALFGTKVQCAACNGTGYVECPECSGVGTLSDFSKANAASNFLPEEVTCPTCGGSGKVPCKFCDGTGWRISP